MLLLAKFKVSGHSMEPTIKYGQYILVSKLPYIFSKPKNKDIIAFRNKNREILIKRIIKIKGNRYFIQGDNLKDSLDSRSFGYISKNDILGKIIYIF